MASFVFYHPGYLTDPTIRSNQKLTLTINSASTWKPWWDGKEYVWTCGSSKYEVEFSA